MMKKSDKPEKEVGKIPVEFVAETKQVFPFFLKEPAIGKDLIPEYYDCLEENITDLGRVNMDTNVKRVRNPLKIKAIDNETFLVYARSSYFRIVGRKNFAFYFQMAVKDVRVHDGVVYILFEKGLMIYDFIKFRFYKENIKMFRISSTGQVMLLMADNIIKVFSNNSFVLEREMPKEFVSFTPYLGFIIFYSTSNGRVIKYNLKTMEYEEVYYNRMTKIIDIALYKNKLFITLSVHVFVYNMVDKTAQNITFFKFWRMALGDVIRLKTGPSSFMFLSYNDLRICGTVMYDESIKDFDVYEDTLFLLTGDKVKICDGVSCISHDVIPGYNSIDNPRCFIFKTDDFERVFKEYYEFSDVRGRFVENSVVNSINQDFCEIFGITTEKEDKKQDIFNKSEIKDNKAKRRKKGF